MSRMLFMSSKALLENMKSVNVLFARDGVYEIRKTEVGIFCAKISEHLVEELEPCVSGLKFNLPKIPFCKLQQIISLFKKYCFICDGIECMCQILWDRVKNEYFVFIPEQRVTKYRVDAVIEPIEYYQQQMRYISVMDIHSHNSMGAIFSDRDDEHEKQTMLYAVIGQVNNFLPDITVRFSCGGNFVEIPANMVFENPFEDYPADWEDKIVVGRDEEDE